MSVRTQVYRHGLSNFSVFFFNFSRNFFRILPAGHPLKTLGVILSWLMVRVDFVSHPNPCEMRRLQFHRKSNSNQLDNAGNPEKTVRGNSCNAQNNATSDKLSESDNKNLAAFRERNKLKKARGRVRDSGEAEWATISFSTRLTRFNTLLFFMG